MTLTNTVTYYDTAKMMNVKSFKVQAPGLVLNKLLMLAIKYVLKQASVFVTASHLHPSVKFLWQVYTRNKILLKFLIFLGLI
jgi:hypothetical protein